MIRERVSPREGYSPVKEHGRNGWDFSRRKDFKENLSVRVGKREGGDFRARLFSIFVGNLNPLVDSSTLWGVFKAFGRVRDVFLYSKSSFRKSGFAFIRFESLEEAKAIALKTTGMHVYGWPIVSKIAKYGWSRRRGSSYQASSDKVGREGFQGGFSGHKNFLVNRSFADTVANNQIGSRREAVKDKEDMLTMEWSHQQVDQDWIKRCAVGVLKQFSDVSSVNNRLSAKGFKFSSAYLGDKCILWCFETESEKEGFRRNRFYWDDCFTSMINWSKALIPQTKTMWINVKNVPLCYWDSKLFFKLGWMIGEPLLVDEETRLRSRFDRGRVLVLLPKHQPFSSVVKVIMEDDYFVVKMEEDGLSADVLWIEHFLGLHKGVDGCLPVGLSDKSGCRDSQGDKVRRQSDEAGNLSAKVSSQRMGERKDTGGVVIAVGKSVRDVVNSGGKCERVDIVKKGVNDFCGGSKNKDKGEVSFEVESLGWDGLNFCRDTAGLDSLSWKGNSDVSPLVSVVEDKLGEGDNVDQLLLKDNMVSKVAGVMCKSEYALAGVISKSKLLRGGKGTGGLNCSKPVVVGLERCGFHKLEGLLRGPEVGFAGSTSVNKRASDQVPHVLPKFGAEDEGLVKFGIGKVAISSHDNLIDAEEHDRSIKGGRRKKNHSIKRHGVKKASWKLKEVLAEAIEAEIDRRIKAELLKNN